LSSRRDLLSAFALVLAFAFAFLLSSFAAGGSAVFFVVIPEGDLLLFFAIAFFVVS
jgi:hypothetical protein